MSSRHIIKKIWHFGFVHYDINFYCTLKNDIHIHEALAPRAISFFRVHIIFQSAIKIDVALTQVPHLYNIELQK